MKPFNKASLKNLLKMSGEQESLTTLLKRKRKIREKRMNKTELAFSKLLGAAQKNGQIVKWHFEQVTLKLAPNTRYTPDFIAVLPNGHWQVFEIKGHLEDDAAVKFKSACEKFSEMSFHMLRKKQGKWETIYNLPSTYNSLTILDPQGEMLDKDPKK